MQVIREVNDFVYNKRSVVTIGTFDGVHLGHQKIIEKLNLLKNTKELRSIIVSFEPHPQIVLRNRTKDIRILSTLEEKLRIFRSMEIDIAFIINFTKEFANTTADDFYKNYLIEKIGLSDLVLGYDHMFGKNREGNFDTLTNLAKKYDFTVDKVDELKIDGEHVSSTVIRHLLEGGNIKRVTGILGRYYSIEGKVIQGKKLGKGLGYPTANIQLSNDYKLVPKTGIYAVEAEVNSNVLYGMMSIGKNPTVTEDESIKLEVNLFDFDENIYGSDIRVNFIDYIRDEIKYDSVEELKEQIYNDKQTVLNILKETENKINN